MAIAMPSLFYDMIYDILAFQDFKYGKKRSLVKFQITKNKFQTALNTG